MTVSEWRSSTARNDVELNWFEYGAALGIAGLWIASLKMENRDLRRNLTDTNNKLIESLHERKTEADHHSDQTIKVLSLIDRSHTRVIPNVRVEEEPRQ